MSIEDKYLKEDIRKEYIIELDGKEMEYGEVVGSTGSMKIRVLLSNSEYRKLSQLIDRSRTFEIYGIGDY